MGEQPKVSARRLFGLNVPPREKVEGGTTPTIIRIEVNRERVSYLYVKPEYADEFLSLLNGQRLRRRLVEACDYFCRHSAYVAMGIEKDLAEHERHRITLSEGRAAEGMEGEG